MTLGTQAETSHDLPHRSRAEFLVARGLRIKGQAGTPALARSSGLASPEIAQVLAELEGRGVVERRSGPLAGWSLTALGRQRHVEDTAVELSQESCGGCRTTVRSSFDAFARLNGELLEVVTAWQMRSVSGGLVRNDHNDRVYDGAVLRRVAGLHSPTRDLCHQLTSVLTRFGTYEIRLSEALARCRHGEPEWLDYPGIDSYHTVWFELHEDLSITLGLPRESS